MHRFSPNLDQMNASVAGLIILFALQVTSFAAPELSAPDPLKWTIQEKTSRRAETSHATDLSLDFDSVIPGKPSDLRLAIDRVETSASRREFRISVSGIQSVDQVVDVWVSGDLQTWIKLEDSVIEISERGERRILIPLDSRMQFFRVTLSE